MVQGLLLCPVGLVGLSAGVGCAGFCWVASIDLCHEVFCTPRMLDAECHLEEVRGDVRHSLGEKRSRARPLS